MHGVRPGSTSGPTTATRSYVVVNRCGTPAASSCSQRPADATGPSGLSTTRSGWSMRAVCGARPTCTVVEGAARVAARATDCARPVPTAVRSCPPGPRSCSATSRSSVTSRRPTAAAASSETSRAPTRPAPSTTTLARRRSARTSPTRRALADLHDARSGASRARSRGLNALVGSGCVASSTSPRSCRSATRVSAIAGLAPRSTHAWPSSSSVRVPSSWLSRCVVSSSRSASTAAVSGSAPTCSVRSSRHTWSRAGSSWGRIALLRRPRRPGSGRLAAKSASCRQHLHRVGGPLGTTRPAVHSTRPGQTTGRPLLVEGPPRVDRRERLVRPCRGCG